ncbi:hypothetical protein MMC10_005868 [Thelotrema lepadinum]|nr:hypothetical protein [Thelotrema lepadinum]
MDQPGQNTSEGVVTPKHTRSSTCSTVQSFDDELEDFAEVMELITPSALIDIATAIRGGLVSAVSVGDRPMCGSFNLVYVIHFEDNSKWVARIPQFATPAHFHAAQAQHMSTELELLRLIRSKTTIPVPEVFHYDTTFDNPFGVPFSLEGWLGGCSVGALWSKTDGPTPCKERQRRILESVASAMAQLSLFAHPEIGVPKVDPIQSTAIGTEKLRSRDVDKEMHYCMHGWPQDGVQKPFAFLEQGPFHNTADYLRSMLYSRKLPWEEREIKRTKDDLVGSKRLMEIIIDAIESIEQQEHPSTETPGDGSCQFVIRHPDFALQNVLVSEDGSLLGLLDWDGIQTVPKTFGFTAYPDWIIRDWEPSFYHYWEEGEGSMSELRELRETYRGFLATHLEESNKPKRNCHLYQVVEMACKQKNNLVPVTTKLGRVCLGEHLFNVTFEYMEATYTAGPGKNWLDRDSHEEDQREYDDEDEEDESDCDDSDVEEEDRNTEEHDHELVDEAIVTREVTGTKDLPPLAAFLIKFLILIVWLCAWLALLHASSALVVGGWLDRMLAMLFTGHGIQSEAQENPWASVRTVEAILWAPYKLLVTSDGYQRQRALLQAAPTERIRKTSECSTVCDELDLDLEHQLLESVQYACSCSDKDTECLDLDYQCCLCLMAGYDAQIAEVGKKVRADDEDQGDDQYGLDSSDEEAEEEEEEEDDEDEEDSSDENSDEAKDKDMDKDDEDEDDGDNDDDAVPEDGYKPDPNQETPDWLWELLMALGQGTVSEEDIEKLKNRFIEKFSSEELVEEWALS